jgi:hypothetical protein
MIRLHTLLLALIVILSPAAQAGAADPVPTGASPVVVELFTSQGCSSCPPADALLAEIAGRPDVIALSLHVDYWDYLGWRDTFARKRFTKRQYAYRDAFDARVVYTPQMVVHGQGAIVGSRKGDLAALLTRARAREPGCSIVLLEDHGMLRARLLPGARPATGVVWVAYLRDATVSILHGENAGREVTYHNVVQSLTRLGVWEGHAAEEIELPQPGAGEGVAIWVQSGEVGPIQAAVKVER